MISTPGKMKLGYLCKLIDIKRMDNPSQKQNNKITHLKRINLFLETKIMIYLQEWIKEILVISKVK
jgi:hypothetical protein